MSTPLRIVSLLPSATECLYLLGLGERLVGRSHECDAPDDARALPVCTRSLVRDGSGAEIDAEVRRRMAQGLPLYELDHVRLRALAPTHIVTQAQCDVCAVGEREVEALLAEGWTAAKPEVIALAPRTFGDVFADLQHLGHALGVAQAGRDAATKLAARVSEVGEKTGDRRPRPRVLCLEWLDPPIAAGNWMPEIVRVAGGEPLFGRTGEHSRDVAWAEIEAAAPDFVLVMPCGFDLERSLDEARALAQVPEWQRLGAVRHGRAVVVDGNAYFNRSGPRLVDSLELLAELLWPQTCSTGWKRSRKQRASRPWTPDRRAPGAQPSSVTSPVASSSAPAAAESAD